MIRFFITGDVHIGKKYDRYSDIKDRLIESRFECLERCVKKADQEHCDFFIITGDLFDNVSGIKQKDVRRVVDILSGFGGRVIVLPGNHDYYTGEEKVWKDFNDALAITDHNIILITEFKNLTLDAGEEKVTFYPAFCQSKHSSENNLGWIKAQSFEGLSYHIGLAHGSLVGLSPDMKNQYFMMSENELNTIPVDSWFIGHTHIPYPADIPESKEISGYRIYNPGTPEQTDLSNNTTGLCFIVTLAHDMDGTKITAHSYPSGVIRYFDITLSVTDSLESSIRSVVRDLPEKSVIRLTLKGSVASEDYAEREKIYDNMLSRFLTFEIEDKELSELITIDKIRSEFAEVGFAAKLLEDLSDPMEVQMAYELIKRHRA